MSLLEMSFAGGVLILAVIVLRALALNRLPKGTFLALWAVAALRLLVPFSIPSPASVYTLAETVQVRTAVPAAAVPAGNPAAAAGPVPANVVPAGTTATAPESGAAVDVWLLVWLAGAAVCGAFFLISYLRCRREFRMALPAEDSWAQGWLAGQSLRRTVSLRQSDRVDAPLTYGLLRPVILLPKSTDWTDRGRLRYVLEHELTHIRCLDALWKLALAFTACVHWFNPLVWCMFVLANRDMELRCDEVVVRHMGLDRRGDYALALISLEEKKSGLGPFASAFNKNAIEERIRAIMKIKKHSLAAVLAAVVLVCCVGVAFATSAAENNNEIDREDNTVIPYPEAEEEFFTKEELDRLASLWFEGYEDMTVTEYQKKLWIEYDTPEDIKLIDNYGQYTLAADVWTYGESSEAADLFNNYFFYVYEPLTAGKWQERTFSDSAGIGTEDGGSLFLEYTCTLNILAPDTLTVGEYQQMPAAVKQRVQDMLDADLTVDDFAALSQRLSTDALSVMVEAGLPVRSYGPDDDTALYEQSSRASSENWDRTLSPYAPFGLIWQFDDPDLDGNGLTMWFEGKEVRGICDERKGLWITEHTGNSDYSDGAVELYTVYTDGVLTGLRLATPEEQAAWDESRQTARPMTIPSGLVGLPSDPAPEKREFPRATWEHYESLLALRTIEDTDLPEWASHPYRDARDLTLADFNQRLLDWANENPIPWDYINCDVLWNDYGVELTEDELSFVALTCQLSGTENGQMVRALYTGNPEEDPRISASMPPLAMISEYADGCVTAWCDLYYDISYHIADKSKVTVRERDNCVDRMTDAINTFWQDTDFDVLLTMTEEDVVSCFNAWAEESATENIRFNPITADNIHFEHNDERGID